MTFSSGYLRLGFTDNGTKLSRTLLAPGTVLSNSVENVADGDIPGIASAFEKAVAIERLLHPIAVSRYDISELPLGLIIVAEYMVDVFTDVGCKNPVGTLVKPTPVLMVGNREAVRLYPC